MVALLLPSVCSVAPRNHIGKMIGWARTHTRTLTHTHTHTHTLERRRTVVDQPRAGDRVRPGDRQGEDTVHTHTHKRKRENCQGEALTFFPNLAAVTAQAIVAGSSHVTYAEDETVDLGRGITLYASPQQVWTDGHRCLTTRGEDQRLLQTASQHDSLSSHSLSFTFPPPPPFFSPPTSSLDAAAATQESTADGIWPRPW